MTVTEISALFEYDEWATRRTLEAVSAVPGERYLADLKSSHGGIHGTLVHTYGATIVWFSRWNGTSPARLVPVEEVPGLDALKERWKKHWGDLHAYLGVLTAERIAEPLAYNDLKGNRQSEPLYQQMQHCINHATYHRGQVVTLLRQVGATPANTDLVAFYRTRPARPISDTLEQKNY